MRNKWLRTILCLLLLTSAASFSEAAQKHTVIECTIYDMDGNALRYYPWHRCIFFSDGSIVAGNRNRLLLLDKQMNQKWSFEMDTHHQINASENGKEILVITSDIKKFKGALTRFDALAVYDLRGNRKKYFSYYNHKEELDKFVKKFKMKNFISPISEDVRRDPDVKVEFSHVNSFYEIPENTYSKSNKTFAAGNYIINDNNNHMMFILDSSLTKILWAQPQDSNRRAVNFHDVQMLPSGNLLIYRNLTPNDKGLKYSTILEMNPLTREEKILYAGSAEEPFYSEFCGGVQILENGNILFDDFTSKPHAVEISGNKRIWKLTHWTKDKATKEPSQYQQSKRLDLTEFLKNNAGL